MPDSVGARLVEAISAQDAATIADCFTSEAQFRALIPPGLREREGAEEVASLIAAWFADSTELDLVESRTEEVGDRLHVAYKFEGVEEGQPYVVEQHLYCTVSDGKILRADLLCSGFRPHATQSPLQT
jgi:SnoaL-like domain